MWKLVNSQVTTNEMTNMKRGDETSEDLNEKKKEKEKMNAQSSTCVLVLLCLFILQQDKLCPDMPKCNHHNMPVAMEASQQQTSQWIDWDMNHETNITAGDC